MPTHEPLLEPARPPMPARRLSLIQIRDNDSAEHHELLCVSRTAGLPPTSIETVNVVRGDRLNQHALLAADALVIGGAGAHSVTEDYEFMEPLLDVVRRVVDEGLPVFGICWGHHFLARAFGGRVETDRDSSEVGTFEVTLTDAGRADPLFEGLPNRFEASLVHHDRIAEPAPGMVELARSEACPFQAVRLSDKPVYGTQFHGEMDADQLRWRLGLYQGRYLAGGQQPEDSIPPGRQTHPAAGTLLRRFLEIYT